MCVHVRVNSPHNDTLFRLAPLAYICHTVRRFSIFIPHERRHWPAYSNPGQFAGRAVLANHDAAGRMARRSWIYIVCLGENWFFMRDTWEYLPIHAFLDAPHGRVVCHMCLPDGRFPMGSRWRTDLCIYQHVKCNAPGRAYETWDMSWISAFTSRKTVQAARYRS